MQEGKKKLICNALAKTVKRLRGKKSQFILGAEYDIPSSVKAPVNFDTIIGKVKVLNGDEEIYSENLYAIDTSRNIDIKYLIENIISNW